MKRLQAVFSLITPCGLFADIGTDHGLIAMYASGIADRVIATDISEKCLAKAKKFIKATNVEFAAGDGLTPLPADPDIIAICGMGGYTVTGILADYSGKATLILQPQNDLAHVRAFLTTIGYTITDDIIAFDSGKYYDILRAVKGEGKPEMLTVPMLLFGKFYQKKNILLKNRLLQLKQSYLSYKQTPQNLEFLAQIDDALAFQ